MWILACSGRVDPSQKRIGSTSELGNQRRIIGATFRAVGLAIGVPSLIALVGLAAADLTYRPLPAAETVHDLDIGTYGLVALLVDGARGVAATFGFAITAMDWIIKAVAAQHLSVFCSG
jgi:hypothetical protein